MKVTNLKSSHIKTLEAIDITPGPDGKVILAGKNGHGKSSALDSLWLAIEYRAAIKTIDKPLKDGEDEGFTHVELSEKGVVQLIVKRHFKRVADSKEITTSLVVTDGDGNKKSSPQAILDKLCGHLSFDPLEFSTMDDARRLKIVMDLTGLDFAEIDSDYQQQYDKRHDLARDGKAALTVRDSLEKPDPELPKETKSVSELSEELLELNDFNARNAEKIHNRNAAKNEVKHLSNESQRVQQEIKDMEAEMEDVKQRFEEKRQAFLNKITVIEKERSEAYGIANATADTEAWTGTKDIQEQIRNAETINKKILDAKEYNQKNAEVQEFAVTHRKCERTLLMIREAKQKMIEGAKYPLPGMSVKEDQVIYEGMPFKDLSDGQKLLVSTSMAIALHPELQIICLRNSQLLDSDNLQIVYDIAKEKGFDVWRETIETDDAAALHFVNGSIVS